MKKKYYWFFVLIFIVFISCCVAETPKVTFKVVVWPPTNLTQCKNFDTFPKKTDERSRGECYTYLAVKNKNETICNSIEVSADKQLCILSVAIEKKDLSLCKLLVSNETRDSCENKINCELKPIECGISDCKSETDLYERSNCFSILAVSQKNISICNYVESSITLLDCIVNVLSELNETSLSLCDQLINSKSKEACLATIAVNTKNTTICSQIKDEFYKNWCLGK